MTNEDQYSKEIYEGPSYALVIGISIYNPEKDIKEDPGQLGVDEFPNLKYASKDASNFADFLNSNGFIPYTVTVLPDQKATKSKIIEGIDELRKNCRNSGHENPLVIIFFSGHGWVDSENRQYLVPCDAKRTKLLTEGIRIDDFYSQLKEIKSDRLIVFLDACHSAGQHIPNMKGADRFDSRKLRKLGEGSGRYFLSSCDHDQKSWEWEEEESGIFTKHLLDLLKCEEDLIDDEEISIENLWPVLQKKVTETAKKVHGRLQEPTANVQGGKDIVLAINTIKRRKRLVTRYHEKLETRFPREKEEKFRRLIKDYVSGVVIDKYQELYSLFNNCFESWQGGVDDFDTEYILLKNLFDEILKTPEEAKKEPEDAFSTESKANMLGNESIEFHASISGEQKRNMFKHTSDIIKDPALLPDDLLMGLFKKLRKPITHEKFIQFIEEFTITYKGDSNITNNILPEIKKRFEDYWKKESESDDANPLSIYPTT